MQFWNDQCSQSMNIVLRRVPRNRSCSAVSRSKEFLHTLVTSYFDGCVKQRILTPTSMIIKPVSYVYRKEFTTSQSLDSVLSFLRLLYFDDNVRPELKVVTPAFLMKKCRSHLVLWLWLPIVSHESFIVDRELIPIDFASNVSIMVVCICTWGGFVHFATLLATLPSYFNDPSARW